MQMAQSLGHNCPANASEMIRYRAEFAQLRGVWLGERELQRETPQWSAAHQRVHEYPCLGRSGRIALPLRWGDPPARQVKHFHVAEHVVWVLSCPSRLPTLSAGAHIHLLGGLR